MDLAIFWVVRKKNIIKKSMFKMCFRTQITLNTYFSEKVGSLDGLSHFLGGSEKKYKKKIYV